MIAVILMLIHSDVHSIQHHVIQFVSDLKVALSTIVHTFINHVDRNSYQFELIISSCY